MNSYFLSIYNENVRKILENDQEYKPYLQGVSIDASSEDEAREIANKSYNVNRAYAIQPSIKIPEIPEINDYWDLWLNPKYTKIEKIN